MADSNPTQDPFEMFRRLWGPLGLPVPGMAMPTLDPREVEKRIADLRSVEAWLSMNLNMVRFSMQGLELQKAALNAMRAGGEAAAQAPAGSGEAGGGANAMLWPWAMMQQAMAGQAAAAKGGAAEPEAKQEKQESQAKKAEKKA